VTPVLPRYSVGSLTGYAHSGRRGKPYSTWYVYDRLWNHRLVARFDDRYEYGFLHRVKHTVPAERQARSKARKLERRYRKTLRQRGLL